MEDNRMKSRLSILIIGSYQFDDDYFPTLSGVPKDLNLIKELLFENSNALYSEITPTILENPTSEEIREYLTQFVYSRSAEQDYLLIYYSGHGAVVNGNQFAFICRNSQVYSINDKIIPSTIITSTEIINTLDISKTIPIMIVDACHSALINPKSTLFSNQMVMDSLRDNIHSLFASDFMLFCACAEHEVTPETSLGGYFSRHILEISQKGDKNNPKKPLLTINDVYKIFIRKNLTESRLGIEPRLYFGYGVSDFPLIKNNSYKPITERLNNYQLKILELLWNHGNPIQIGNSELDKNIGKGAYANYSKLSYEPWRLIKKKSKIVLLSDRGIQFMKNELDIPDVIIKDDSTNGTYRAEQNAKFKSYNQFRAQMALFEFDDN
jgi:hypothetical protein